MLLEDSLENEPMWLKETSEADERQFQNTYDAMMDDGIAGSEGMIFEFEFLEGHHFTKKTPSMAIKRGTHTTIIVLCQYFVPRL